MIKLLTDLGRECTICAVFFSISLIVSMISVIEIINNELKNVAQLVHSRHRSVFIFAMNVLFLFWLHTDSMRRSRPSISIIASNTLMSSLLLYNKGILSLLTNYR